MKVHTVHTTKKHVHLDHHNRREFITRSGAGMASLLLLGGCASREAIASSVHPRIYVRPDGVDGFRTVSSVRNAILNGHSKLLWDTLLESADADAQSPILQPDSYVEKRPQSQIDSSNLDYYIVHAAGKRITRNALASLLTGETSYKEIAMAQLQAVVDDWPDWIDQAHMHLGNPAGLRTGMLAFDVSLAFDWLYDQLSADERQYVIDGLDRKAIQPFLTSLSQDAWWMRDLNNWTTTICGGLGVCGTALHGHHPSADELIRITDGIMETYLKQYGPNGEFNENPSYANATVRPVEYYMARHYASNGTSSRIQTFPFPDSCYWVKYLTMPSGYIAAFGDSHTDSKPWTNYIAAIASATSDPVLQHFYLNNHGGQSGNPVELLWFDPELASDEGADLPLGRVYPAFGGCVSSRTSWDDSENVCTVFGKASREDNHEHHDAGTVCIDGFRERLIVDLGSPSGYPADFFEDVRYEYYNASILGHNILMFDREELRVPDWKRGDGPKKDLSGITGRFTGHNFDRSSGGWWRMDLSQAYRNGEIVERTVIHLFPGYVAVLDKAVLPVESNISLRWHTIDNAEPSADGSFTVRGDTCGLVCKVSSLTDLDLSFQRNQHEYRAPYHQDRTATDLDQRRESYVEASQRGNACHLLSVFALEENPSDIPWSHAGNKLTRGQITCTVNEEAMILTDISSGLSITAPLTS